MCVCIILINFVYNIYIYTIIYISICIYVHIRIYNIYKVQNYWPMDGTSSIKEALAASVSRDFAKNLIKAMESREAWQVGDLCHCACGDLLKNIPNCWYLQINPNYPCYLIGFSSINNINSIHFGHFWATPNGNLLRCHDDAWPGAGVPQGGMATPWPPRTFR